MLSYEGSDYCIVRAIFGPCRPQGAILFEFLETVILHMKRVLSGIWREIALLDANDCVMIFLYEILVQFVLYFNLSQEVLSFL